MEIAEVNNLVFDSIAKNRIWDLSTAFKDLEKFLGRIVSNKEIESKSRLTLALKTALQENLKKSMGSFYSSLL